MKNALSDIDEPQLIEQIINGDIQSYRLLVEKYQRYVYSAALKIVSSTHDAEDVAQETFVKAYKNLSKFNGQSKFSTWLYRIAINTAISKRRKQRFHSDDIGTIDYMESESSNYNKPLKTNEQKDYLQQAFQLMGEDDVTILTLFYLKELHLNEIADILNITISNAKVRIHRARKRLAENMRLILKHETQSLI